MSDALDIEGLDDAVKLVLLDLGGALRTAGLAIAAEAQDRIAPYPEPSGKPQAFKTRKQRRGFFAKLRSGAIQVPYRRRGAAGGVLGRWSITMEGDNVVLRNTDPAAAFVHGERQAKYFRGSGWKSVKGVAKGIKDDGTAGRIAEQAIQEKFDKGGSGG